MTIDLAVLFNLVLATAAVGGLMYGAWKWFLKRYGARTRALEERQKRIELRARLLIEHHGLEERYREERMLEEERDRADE